MQIQYLKKIKLINLKIQFYIDLRLENLGRTSASFLEIRQHIRPSSDPQNECVLNWNGMELELELEWEQLELEWEQLQLQLELEWEQVL